MAKIASIKVHLDSVNPYRLSYRPEGVKGAKWRGGFKSIEEVSKAADKAGVPVPRELDYVLKKR